MRSTLPLRFRYLMAAERVKRFPARVRLYYGIGHVAQANAQAEMMLRSIWSTLVFQGHGTELPPRLQNRDKQPRKIEDITEARRRMLAAKNATLTEGVRQAAEMVFESVTNAQNMRHRVIHDIWIYDSDNSQPGWMRMSPESTSEGIPTAPSGRRYVGDALKSARMAQAQVQDLVTLLWHELGIVVGGTPQRSVPELLDRMRRRGAP